MENRKIKYIIIFFIVFFIISLAGCGRTEHSSLKKEGYLYLGLVVPLSGPLRPMGESVIRGAQLAVDAANTAGGIKGRPVKLRIEDETRITDMPDSQRLARDPRVVLIIGHLLESAFEASRRLYLESGLPVLLPFLSGDEVSLSDRGLFFRLMASDSAQAEALANYAAGTMKMRRFLIVRDGSAYGSSLSQAFMKAMKRYKKVSLKTIVYMDSTKRALASLREAAANKPEGVFLALDGRLAVSIVKTLSDQDARIVFLGTHALAFSDTAGFLSTLASHVFFSLPFDYRDNAPAGEKFTKAFKSCYHMLPNWLAVMANDAVNLGLEALAAAGDRPDRIREHLKSLDNPGKAFQGLAGNYYFGSKGRGIKPVFVTRLKPWLLNRLP